MSGIIKRILARLKEQAGFSIIEILVSGLVLVIGLVMMSQFFASAAARVLDSDIRSVLHQVASQDIELIRSLDYENVGTVGGHPAGVLAETETRQVDNLTVKIVREILLHTEEGYDGPFPGNYRRVTVNVSAPDFPRLKAVSLVTNVAGHEEGGTADITVTNVAGQPVAGVQIRLTNTHLIPNWDLSPAAFRTDVNGKLLIPGLDPDEQVGYTVEASKTGYSTDVDGPKVVVEGLPYTEYHLTVDLVSTINVRVIDTLGNAVEGLNINVVGPEGFNQTFMSTASGEALTELRYSTDVDPYIIRLLDGQGYAPQQEVVELGPGTVDEVLFTVPAGGPTTTLPPSTTTTVTPSTTSTTTTSITIPGGLTLNVAEVWNQYQRRWVWTPMNRATVTLTNSDTGYYESRRTNSQGIVAFTGLTNGMEYSIHIEMRNYSDHHETIVIQGATAKTIRWGES